MRRCFERDANAMQHFCWSVADADHSRRCVFCNCLGDKTCGTGEIDEPCIRSKTVHLSCLFDGNRHCTQGHGRASRTGRLLPWVAVLNGDALVVRACWYAANPHAVEHEISPAYSSFQGIADSDMQ